MGASRRPAGDKDLPREVWLLMSDLVLDHDRRRKVTDAVGMSFSRARAVRRVARTPMSMRDLAAALDIDPPNASTLVNDLEAQGLVRRRPHPTDRRAKVVEATRKGKALARRADEILGTPPESLARLSDEDLATLDRILTSIGVSPTAPRRTARR